jgi:polysaccharide export outer membrane protein
MSGGISTRGKSRFVKVMRKVNEKREIYLIDISNIDGIKYADMIVQANDYIYIEPRAELVKGTLSEWAPISSLISSVLITYSIFQKYK